MKTKISSNQKTAICAGAIAGMRSMSAPVWAYCNSGKKDTSQKLAAILQIAAIGEMIFDKAPMAPNRIIFPSVAGRAVCGAVAGIAANRGHRQQKVKGALIGAAAAVATTFLAYYVRKYMSKKLRIDDPIIGAVEDGIVLAASTWLLGKSKE